jgi:enoyl-CoA hydratase/carnithine racemase
VIAGLYRVAGGGDALREAISGWLTRRLALSSQSLPVAALHSAGIIDEICPADALFGHASARTATLAAQPGFAIVKQQVVAPLRARLSALVFSGDVPFWEAEG